MSGMLMDISSVVGDDAGLLNWDNLCLFLLPLLAAEKEDDCLALLFLFLFHSGVQMTLALDGDGDAGVISAGGGVLWLYSWDVGCVVMPTAPSAWSWCPTFPTSCTWWWAYPTSPWPPCPCLAILLSLPPLCPIRMTFRQPLGRHQVELMPSFLVSGILLATYLMVCH